MNGRRVLSRGAIAALAALLLLAAPSVTDAQLLSRQSGALHRLGWHDRAGSITFATFGPDDEDGTSIGVVKPDGRNRTTIANFGYDPRWSPNGHRIAVSGCRPEAPAPCATTIMTPRGRIRRELPVPSFFPADTAFGPSVWSPDRRYLAGGADSSQPDLNGLYTVRAHDGEHLTRLTSNPGGEDIPGSYSPDGKTILFVRDVPDGQGGLTATGLFSIGTDGNDLHRVTPADALVNPEHGGRWSPDGRSILFDARPDADSRFTLWTIRPNGTHVHRLPISLPCGLPTDDPTAFGCFAPSWSPDGRHIVFGTVDAVSGQRNLYTVDRAGRHLHQVTFGDVSTDVPDWGGQRSR
jgi:Tol biopolymer transport system component